MDQNSSRERDYRQAHKFGAQLTVDTNTRMSANEDQEERRIQWRQKQIDIGKNTIGYENYIRAVPKEARNPSLRTSKHPSTPPVNESMSKRKWLGYYNIWRSQLHGWDEGEGYSSRKELDQVKSTLKPQATQQPESVEEDMMAAAMDSLAEV